MLLVFDSLLDLRCLWPIGPVEPGLVTVMDNIESPIFYYMIVFLVLEIFTHLVTRKIRVYDLYWNFFSYILFVCSDSNDLVLAINSHTIGIIYEFVFFTSIRLHHLHSIPLTLQAL